MNCLGEKGWGGGGEGLGTPPAPASGWDGQVGPHTLQSPGVSFSLQLC